MIKLIEFCACLNKDIKHKKKKAIYSTNKLIRCILNILVNFNVILFYKLNNKSNKATVFFKRTIFNTLSCKAVGTFFKKKQKIAVKASQIKKVALRNSKTLSIYLTSKGILTHNDAILKNTGGILLLKIVV